MKLQLFSLLKKFLQASKIFVFRLSLSFSAFLSVRILIIVNNFPMILNLCMLFKSIPARFALKIVILSII